MLPHAEKAVASVFEEHEIVAEIICPIQLYPLNLLPAIESVEQSGRLLIVEEGHSFAALGAEVIAGIQERRPGLLSRCKRLASAEHPIPSSGPLEIEILPDASAIVKAICELVRNV
jgi:2-oxoisovalerate dehydrogenase E1 component